MPILFTPHEREGYLLTTVSGKLGEDEMLTAYREYYEHPNWVRLDKELTDLRGADLSAVSTSTLRKLSQYAEGVFATRGIESYMTAVVAPHDLQFGLARLYQALAAESPESLRVFRELEPAIEWLAIPAPA